MQQEAMERVKPGVEWEDLHILTHRILVERFLELGIFHNGSTDEIMAARISVGFYPHGLGHTLGMDTHDTAGHADYNDSDPMVRYLRIRRKLEANMVVTVEPGCYFNEFLLNPLFKDPTKSKYINKQVLDRYMPVGGVRLVDDVRVTSHGFENFTKVTKDADEVAALVRAGLDKGRDGFHCVV
jgi:Xaa-Pro dipeptidase